MPTLQEVKDKIDPVLLSIATKVDARQATYATNHGGRFFQGLWTNNADIVDAVDTTPDNLSSRPTDQAERWSNFVGVGDLPTQLPCRLRCDVYRNINGWGYSLTVQVMWNANLYARARNMRGDETWRTQGWQQIMVE